MIEFLIDQVFDANLLIAMLVAAFAGVVSFFSPCVIPLVPGYLAYASGMSDTKSRSRVFSGLITICIWIYSFICFLRHSVW